MFSKQLINTAARMQGMKPIDTFIMKKMQFIVSEYASEVLMRAIERAKKDNRNFFYPEDFIKS